ncbi:NADPH2:quinone reductase [Inquilinus ginsengisoli]|uniref:quinone oxidoreductase family protein n=1 Tax=Inquilinus ginsengisoli TaxID=363840 RepID=UPI003D19F7C3
MEALVFDRFGGPEVLEYRTLPDPAVPPGHVQLALRVAGLNFADLHRRRGNYRLAGAAPHIAGYEGAGEVVALGDGVAGIRLGGRIGFADVPFANASRVTVPVDRAIPLPDDIGYREAAAILLQGLTAQYLVADSAPVRAGARVLVHAAAGGVGQLLVQMAKRRGATVIALASTAGKAAIAVARGADHGLTYDDDWVATVRDLSDGGVDIAYDSVGTTLAQSLDATRPRGTVVAYGTAGGDPPAIDPRLLMEQSKAVVGGDLWDHLDSRASRLARADALFAALRSGELALPEIEAFPLSRGADAHRRLESRAVTGKIVLVPDGAG